MSRRLVGARWPTALARWGVSPVVALLWAAHEVIVGLAAAAPFPMGTGGSIDGLPWFRWDVPFYAAVAHAGYGHLPKYYAAYFPGVPAYLWTAHWPLVALVGMQLVFLALLIQTGRLASAWGLMGGRVSLAQALVALGACPIIRL